MQQFSEIPRVIESESVCRTCNFVGLRDVHSGEVFAGVG